MNEHANLIAALEALSLLDESMTGGCAISVTPEQRRIALRWASDKGYEHSVAAIGRSTFTRIVRATPPGRDPHPLLRSIVCLDCFAHEITSPLEHAETGVEPCMLIRLTPLT